MSNVYTVSRVRWQSPHLEKLRSIRHEVFVVEQQVDLAEEWDELDEVADHVLVEDEAGNPVGTGRLHSYEPGVGKICRVAVMKEHRGRGIGKAITVELVSIAREKGHRTVKLHAQTHAVGVYAAVGFTTYGDEFLECNMPHLAMRLELG